MRKKYFFPLLAIIMLMTLVAVESCKKQEIKLSTTDDVNIVGYLRNNADSFSLFVQILERTETDAFLNAYGAYTCFAPTNSGVNIWLNSIGASSVAAANIDVLKDMVRFHLLVDTITTGSFKDGKLPVPTMFGQFLVTGVNFESGVSSYIVNRQANVTKSNIRTGNGIIHQLNRVLVPSRVTIARQLESNPSYSIFTEALKATGFYNFLNTVNPDTSKRWYSVLAETNKALSDSGINSFAALRAKYSNTGDPTRPTDSLYMYVAYHIIPGIYFLGDIINQPSYKTMQPEEVVSVALINKEVVVNEVEFNGILERGVRLNRNTSDNAASNGVWHESGGHFMLKFRSPTAVYWDVSTFEEIQKLPAFYRRQNFNFTRQSEVDQPLKDITWGWGALAGTNVLTYNFSTTSATFSQCVNSDANQLPLGLPSRPVWWEMTTPPIIKGKYKVWICYAQSRQSSGSNQLCQVSVNGEVLPRTMNFVDTRPAGTDAELEAIGWKRYTENTSNIRCGRLVGVYDFKTTDRHKIRITPINGTQNNNFLDMIHFIPIDQNQILPRFRNDGTQIFF